MPKHKKDTKNGGAEDENVTIGGKQLLVTVQDKARRQKHMKRFDEILQVNQQSNRPAHLPSAHGSDDVSTLSVGFIARAMGLNVSNGEVLRMVEMIEDKDVASRGYVSAGLLREMIVEALMTGVLAVPGSLAVSPPPKDKKNFVAPSQVHPPISVRRDDEDTIYRAFRLLDLTKRGYLEAEEMRHFLRGGAEPFTEEEVEEFIVAAADPESGRIYYEDFADVLATE
ncbi:hypothetical protein DQ04_00121150 [Trypanosoma grayi]|uniref:hypothetical protein n=1 Tax=Trypanosoma grayi TaxID=71804 RepID=UPI0004F43F51|nr:hypothetical protein DQ04_00121150 [Trypanosoma grayi]KEG15283.1 hypothetical protein DQ04_00121150 [Trypanosoma grayi]